MSERQRYCNKLPFWKKLNLCWFSGLLVLELFMLKNYGQSHLEVDNDFFLVFCDFLEIAEEKMEYLPISRIKI